MSRGVVGSPRRPHLKTARPPKDAISWRHVSSGRPNCIKCERPFTPIKPKRGPTSKRCSECYPVAERDRVRREQLDWARRRRGEYVPNVVVCAGCGETFDRKYARKYCTPECRRTDYARKRTAERDAWIAQVAPWLKREG